MAIYYTNSYKTLPAEVQKRIDGVALKNGQTEKIINLNQRIYGFPEQLVGSVLNISFSFTINEPKERTRLTTFQIPVQ